LPGFKTKLFFKFKRNPFFVCSFMKVKIEVWSDVVCPFCWLGKRRLDHAISKSVNKDDVDVEWRSFQLNPELKTDAGISIQEYLLRVKGFDINQIRQINSQLTETGAGVGLNYQFDKIVVANSMQAHQLLHEAKIQGKQHVIKENLFQAYFELGKNIDDPQVLLELARDSGMDISATDQSIRTKKHWSTIQSDITQAQQFGVRGVPFFIFNRKFAVRGAQELDIFTQVLEEAWKDAH
jgi:predicted DsbA family dithiol-disulfide isomerase